MSSSPKVKKRKTQRISFSENHHVLGPSSQSVFGVAHPTINRRDLENAQEQVYYNPPSPMSPRTRNNTRDNVERTKPLILRLKTKGGGNKRRKTKRQQ